MAPPSRGAPGAATRLCGWGRPKATSPPAAPSSPQEPTPSLPTRAGSHRCARPGSADLRSWWPCSRVAPHRRTPPPPRPRRIGERTPPRWPVPRPRPRPRSRPRSRPPRPRSRPRPRRCPLPHPRRQRRRASRRLQRLRLLRLLLRLRRRPCRPRRPRRQPLWPRRRRPPSHATPPLPAPPSPRTRLAAAAAARRPHPSASHSPWRLQSPRCSPRHQPSPLATSPHPSPPALTPRHQPLPPRQAQGADRTLSLAAPSRQTPRAQPATPMYPACNPMCPGVDHVQRGYGSLRCERGRAHGAGRTTQVRRTLPPCHPATLPPGAGCSAICSPCLTYSLLTDSPTHSLTTYHSLLRTQCKMQAMTLALTLSLTLTLTLTTDH